LNTLAIIVNYKSVDLTLRAVQSVLDSQSLGPVAVAVVDNSEDEGEVKKLRQALPSSASLRVSPRNVGFGRACNLAFEGFRGDAVLLLNPDARLLAGCLKRLQETLFLFEKAGAVSSHLFWDEECRFYLPASYPPTYLPFQHVLATAPPEASFTRVLSGWWRRHSIKVWGSVSPMRVGNLSGGLVLLKTEAVRSAGGLFDPRFFLYFEDTDLFVRIKKAGFSLMVEPRAQAIHNYDQCGQQDLEQKRSFMAESRQLFLQKYCRGWRRGANKMISGIKWFSGNAKCTFASPQFTQPFILQTPDSIQDGWLFEVSPNPNFIPSAGLFGNGPSIEFPESCWRLLAPGQYFGRIGRPKGVETHFVKFSWTVGDATRVECNPVKPRGDRV
jgi:GT2 family glycosyltransferase